MKPQAALVDFVLREWILVASGAGLALTSFYTQALPAYSLRELEVLFILFALFVAINGLRRSGAIARVSRRLEQGCAIPLKLVLLTFFLSMLVTNDVALLVVVPLTLALEVARRDILVILEALAANAGSALTPLGSPQNLFIYWFYELPPLQFMAAIAPLVILFLVVLVAATLLLRLPCRNLSPPPPGRFSRRSGLYAVLLGVVLLAVLHLLPVWAVALAPLYVLLFDRRVLRVDYSLLFSFLFFFGLAENMRVILEASLRHAGHVFLLSALASQVMSNVPATLLFAKFTDNWEALLWGASVGGFGSLFGSLANLIAYRLYVSHETTRDAGAFTVRFLVAGYAAFFLAIGLYFALFSAPVP